MQDPSWVVILVWGTWLLLTIIIDGLPIPYKLYFSQKTRRKVDASIGDDRLPEVSVVVPAHNEELNIGFCLESLIASRYPEGKMEIILVDDGSQDKTIEKAKSFETPAREMGKKLKIIAKPHTGKVQALNTGLKSTRGSIIITIDADARMARDAIHNIVVPFVNEPEVGAATGYIEITVPEPGIHLDKNTSLTSGAIVNILHLDEATAMEVVTSYHEDPGRDDVVKGDVVITPAGSATGDASIQVRKHEGVRDGILETFFSRCEFLEYITAFNFERSYQSYVQSIYSMSGAFSAFRREVIGKVGGYWPLTVAEDMHMTMMLHNRKVSIIHVPEAVAYVEAITDYDTLYSQRVRWARGQIEVASMQEKQCPVPKEDIPFRDILDIAWAEKSPRMIGHYLQNRVSIKIQRLRQCTYSSFNFMGLQRILLVDHTIAFPRLLWVFVLALFPVLGLYLYIIPVVALLLYAFYIAIDLVVIIFVYQNSPPNTQHQIEKYFPFILLLPVYRLMTFFFRLSAFLQVLKEPSDWTVDGPVNGFKEGVREAKKDANAAKESVVTSIFNLAEALNINLENLLNQGRKGK
ncbi:MAG: glycosyltransferase [Methanobacterium sp.]|nr:glycosyltransferase [Methanobacterium sp.]